MQPLEPVGPLSTSLPKPSIEEPPKLELKELPSTLKYSFLGENQTLPIIISSDLTPSQEEEVIDLLKENKEAIGWTMEQQSLESKASEFGLTLKQRELVLK
ncbi:hypothetical protein CFOL_v3_10608 [Cephalotus follicularis]|uniref:Uncharacterized protein n=1 Tax=Cephalotus follicularis TaxID=3775 RepID=A0A1Q3BGS3_CEPFO|nr:hypothetical protein CFOL_v3_10608 [Cephalotus follicularis]